MRLGQLSVPKPTGTRPTNRFYFDPVTGDIFQWFEESDGISGLSGFFSKIGNALSTAASAVKTAVIEPITKSITQEQLLQAGALVGGTLVGGPVGQALAAQATGIIGGATPPGTQPVVEIPSTYTSTGYTPTSLTSPGYGSSYAPAQTVTLPAQNGFTKYLPWILGGGFGVITLLVLLQRRG